MKTITSTNRISKINPSMKSKKLHLRAGMFTAMLLIASFLLAPALQAQTPAPKQDRPIALTGGTIHTISDGVIQNGTIVFENGVITAIGTNVTIPAGAERVNVAGKHIYPGLIDANSDMGLYEIGAVDMSVDLNETGRINPNIKVEVAVNPESRHIGVARSSGILVTLSSPSGGLISGQAAAIMLDGWTYEDMLIKSGAGMIVNWPNVFNENAYNNGLQELRDVFADAKAYHKARVAADAAGRHLANDTRWEAMIPVITGEMPVIVNANELRQIQDAITWSDEENVRIIIMGGNDAPLVANHLNSRNIPVLVTAVLNSPNRMWEPYDMRYTLPARLHAAGVPFAIAGTSSAPYAYRLPFEAGAAAAYGLDPDIALRAVTLSAAEIMGIDNRVGALKTGLDATLMITTGNPIDYSTQIEQVYIQGRKVDMMDAQRAFFIKYSEKVRQRNLDN